MGKEDKKCNHKKTHFEPWPDNSEIEVCNSCGISRNITEITESAWIMVEDIEKARKEVQSSWDSL